MTPEFSAARRSEAEINVIPTYGPEEIKSKIRERITGIVATAKKDETLAEETLVDEAFSMLSTQHSRARLVHVTNETYCTCVHVYRPGKHYVFTVVGTTGNAQYFRHNLALVRQQLVVTISLLCD